MTIASHPRSIGGRRGRLLLSLILSLAAGGFVVALLFIVQPQDLTDIGGYAPAVAATPARDIRAVLQNSLDRKYPVTLTETEINQWLGRVLSARQTGKLAGLVELDRVLVRLEDDRAEVVMVRRILGQPFTVSMFLKIVQKEGIHGTLTEVQLHGGAYHPDLPLPPRGGRFGRLVVPQGFLLLIMPAYEKLAPLFRPEIHLGLEQMAVIKIANGRLLLDPRDPTDMPSDLPQYR